MVRLIGVSLQRAGHTVTCAYGGEEAIGALMQREGAGLRTYSMAFLDSVMPEVDGYDVLKWIRERDRTKEMWVGMFIPEALRETWEQRPNQPDRYFPPLFRRG